MRSPPVLIAGVLVMTGAFFVGVKAPNRDAADIAWIVFIVLLAAFTVVALVEIWERTGGIQRRDDRDSGSGEDG